MQPWRCLSIPLASSLICLSAAAQAQEGVLPPPQVPSLKLKETLSADAPKPVVTESPKQSLQMPVLPQAPASRSWYGWQTLTVVGLSIPLAWLGDGKPVSYVGLGGVYLGPTMVHFSHGNWEKGVESLGLMSGGFLLGGLAGATVSCSGGACDQGEGQGSGYMIGFGIGAILGTAAALAFDASALAWDEPTSKVRKESPAPTFQFVPQVSVEKGKTTVGLVGMF